MDSNFLKKLAYIYSKGQFFYDGVVSKKKASVICKFLNEPYNPIIILTINNLSVSYCYCSRTCSTQFIIKNGKPLDIYLPFLSTDKHGRYCYTDHLRI
jgi:hypothetical protein